MGPCEAFYASPLQHPFALWAAALAGGCVVLRRRDLQPSLRAYALGLAVLSAVDAWLTASHVYGLDGPLPAALARSVPLGFVLAGDLRFLLLLELATREGRVGLTGAGLMRALALTLIVPLSAQLVVTLLPPPWNAPRVLFLVYEISFVALCAALLRLHPGFARAPWLRGVAHFVITYYALWATADALLLATGSDLGFALRVVPNLLYYGGFVAALAALAPPLRGPRPHPRAA